MTLFTIGFTQKSAERFFGTLRKAGVRQLLDVRLHNVSQLAGFAKRDDLKYFAKALAGIEYEHVPECAPTQEILDSYRKQRSPDWKRYEREFRALMKSRRIEKVMRPGRLDRACLLCAEAKPEHCHRRLVAEYLKQTWKDIEIEHLI